MPGFIQNALEESQVVERYRERPPYQRNDYIGWITRAKTQATRAKRLSQMLRELKEGREYMGMVYRARGSSRKYLMLRHIK